MSAGKSGSTGVLALAMLALLPGACRSLADRAVRKDAERGKALGRYCNSLEIGQHWSPADAKQRDFRVTKPKRVGAHHLYFVRGGVAPRCDIEVNDADGTIATVLYHVD